MAEQGKFRKDFDLAPIKDVYYSIKCKNNDELHDDKELFIIDYKNGST